MWAAGSSARVWGMRVWGMQGRRNLTKKNEIDRPSINFMKGQEFFSLRPIYKKSVHHKGKLESPQNHGRAGRTLLRSNTKTEAEKKNRRKRTPNNLAEASEVGAARRAWTI
jgi:hypothetical protein